MTPGSLPAAFRAALVVRLNSAVFDREAPLAVLGGRAYSMGLTPAVGQLWQPQGWLSMVRSAGFGGAVLRDLLCFKSVEAGGCSNDFCARNLRSSVVSYISSVAVSANETDSDTRAPKWPKQLDDLVQTALEDLATFQIAARSGLSVCRAGWLHGEQVVECSALCSTAPFRNLVMPTILWVLFMGPAHGRDASYRWTDQCITLQVGDAPLKYRAVAVVFLQNGVHYVSAVRFGSQWYMIPYTTVTPCVISSSLLRANALEIYDEVPTMWQIHSVVFVRV